MCGGHRPNSDLILRLRTPEIQYIGLSKSYGSEARVNLQNTVQKSLKKGCSFPESLLKDDNTRMITSSGTLCKKL